MKKKNVLASLLLAGAMFLPTGAFLSAGLYGGPMLFESARPALRKVYKTENPVPGSDTGSLGGRGWIRTTEAEKQQIYSLSPLATREHAQIQFLQPQLTACISYHLASILSTDF